VIPAVLLSALMLLFGAMHWWQPLSQGRLSIPITPLLIALLIWRLVVSRRVIPVIESHAG
jgi:hypothetical protein